MYFLNSIRKPPPTSQRDPCELFWPSNCLACLLLSKLNRQMLFYVFISVQEYNINPFLFAWLSEVVKVSIGLSSSYQRLEVNWGGSWLVGSTLRMSVKLFLLSNLEGLMLVVAYVLQMAFRKINCGYLPLWVP